MGLRTANLGPMDTHSTWLTMIFLSRKRSNTPLTLKGYRGMKGGGSQILVSDTWEEGKNWKLEDTNEPDIAVEKFQTWVTEAEDQGEREGAGVMLRT